MGRKIKDDLTGRNFGNLTVIGFVNGLWKCKCSCGNYSYLTRTQLTSGSKKSCGCVRRAGNLVGKRFGKLTVVKKAGVDKNNFVNWECKCDCGNIKVIRGTSLKRGLTKSCGCLHKKITRIKIPQNK